MSRTSTNLSLLMGFAEAGYIDLKHLETALAHFSPLVAEMKPVVTSVYLLTKFRPKSKRCHGKMFCAPTFVCQHFAAEALPEAWPTGKPWACVCGCVKILVLDSDTNWATDLTARVCSQTHAANYSKASGTTAKHMKTWRCKQHFHHFRARF